MIADDLKILKRITDTLVSNGYLVDQTKEWEYAFDAVPDAIFVINLNHRIRYINKKLSSLLNKTKEEVFNQDCYEVIIGEQSLCDFSECKIGPVDVGEVLLTKLCGWYEISQAPIKSATEKLLGYICILRDVTDKKLARIELEQSEKKYRTLVKNAPVGLYELDLTTFRISNVNDLMALYTEYTREELLAIDVRTLLTPESLKLFVSRVKDASDGKPINSDVDFEIVTKSGEIHWVQLHTSYKYNKIGIPTSVSVVAFDIDEKKRARIEVDRKNRMLESIYRSSPGGIGVVRYPDREILWVNDRVCEITGYTREELVGKNARILYASDEDYHRTGAAKYSLMTNSPIGVGMVRTRLIHKDGSIINVLLISSKIQDEEDRVVFNILDLDFICENTELVVCP
jgi:PAS domain S-box-containing protein